MNEADLRRGRILLVDDDVSSLCLLEGVLNRLRFKNTRKLADSTLILEEFDAYAPDLVITDLEMPGLDGIQLVEQLRNYLPRDTCLPILVLTGAKTSGVKRRALLAGATDILFKPFDSAEIQMRVRNLLETRFQYLEIQDSNRALEEKVQERTAALNKALAELKESQRYLVQQERFRAFGAMAGGVVHDFNNALMSIIGYSDLLLQDESLAADPGLRREYLNIINTAGRDASQVVSRLRDFYRPREESDVFAPVDLNDLIEEVVPLTKPKWHAQALESGRTIRFEFELRKVPLVFGNSAELREVFTNLIFNAVDAMPQGGVITMRTEPLENAVRIQVSDTGTGMTEEVRQRCLEPFFSTKGEHGTGLGLAMAFGIIRRHDGVLDIESGPDRGTTISFTVPHHRSEQAQDEEARLTLSRSLRVLVVDDEPNARDVVTKYLVGDGHRVNAASDGAEAMRRMMAEPFDLVITDHAMPGMNGLRLATEIRRVDPRKPVVLLTGFELDFETESGTVDCVLRKPIDGAELRRTIGRLLGSRECITPARS